MRKPSADENETGEHDFMTPIEPAASMTPALSNSSRQYRNGRLWYFQAFAACLLVLLLLADSALLAQSSSFFNQRDDKYRLLGLKRAKEAYETARAEYERYQDMFTRQLVASAELERVRSSYRDAEVNYQQSLLAVIFEQQYITVASAVKYYAADNSRHVKITIANTSGGSAEFQKLINVEDDLFRSLQPDVVNNIYVSVQNDQGAVIGKPYEAKIPLLKFGEPQSVDFVLLQDLDAVTISLIYSNGSQRSMKVFLQKDATVDRVEVQSEQFSQEVDLGESATFDLALELYSGTENAFTLEAVNLPQQINRSFKDPDSKARLSQLKFSESTRSKRASLTVTLPDLPNEQVVMGKSITFFAAAIPGNKLDRLEELRRRPWTEEELRGLDVGFVRLELVPRGRGKILVRAPQLFQAIHDDEKARFRIELVNEGSNRLDNLEVKVDLPFNWTKQVEPSVIPKLEINEEKSMELTFTPPDDIAVGKYDIRVRTTGTSGGEPVVGEDKAINVEILASASVFGTLFIVILIVGLVAAVIVFGIRLSKR
jgi:hypothetical protein